MLPEFYKFHFVNNLNVDMDLSSNSANEKIDLNYQKWKRASGALSYAASETTQSYSAADIADGGSAEFAEQDNSGDLYDGVYGSLTVETDDGSASGIVTLFVEWSSDGGTTYPSDAADFDPESDLEQLGSVEISGAQTRSIPFAFSLPG